MEVEKIIRYINKRKKEKRSKIYILLTDLTHISFGVLLSFLSLSGSPILSISSLFLSLLFSLYQTLQLDEDAYKDVVEVMVGVAIGVLLKKIIFVL